MFNLTLNKRKGVYHPRNPQKLSNMRKSENIDFLGLYYFFFEEDSEPLIILEIIMIYAQLQIKAIHMVNSPRMTLVNLDDVCGDTNTWMNSIMWQ